MLSILIIAIAINFSGKEPISAMKRMFNKFKPLKASNRTVLREGGL
jgi:hypothetical protein